MTAPDWIPAFARTLVPLVVGPLVARYALDVQQSDLVLAVTTLLGFAYYVSVRVAEHYAPQVGWLLGYAKTPSYSATDGTSATLERPESVLPVAVDVPVQTDNTAKPEDGLQDATQPVETFTGEMR